MVHKEARRLKVGVLGCGPIAQAAHFESCTKARNAELYAICDVAADLLERMGWTHAPERTYADYDAMLADPGLDAVIIATSDAFHVPASIAALEAGKHVLCEKPPASASRRWSACAPPRRTHRRAPGRPHEALRCRPRGRQGVHRDEMGEMLALKAWYCDSTHRYAMTDAVQPLIVTSARPGSRRAIRRPISAATTCSRMAATSSTRRAIWPARSSGRGAAERALRRLLLVRRRRVRQRRARPSRPDRRGAHGLARRLPDLRRERQRHRQDLQSLVLQDQRGRHFPRKHRGDDAGARRGRAFLSPPARRLCRHDPGRRADARRRHRRRRRLGARHGGDRPVGRERPAVRLADVTGAL